MRIGADSTKFPGAVRLNPVELIDRAAKLGLEGVYFRSILELSPTLDRAQLQDVSQQARERGMRLEAGIGKVNPFSTPEAPHIRKLGGGDYRRAQIMMIEGAAAIGIHELWSALSNYQFHLSGLYAFDRFRTDVDWPAQLRATTAFLKGLAPVLRANGTHVNVETHEEITSFELVRIVEEVGPDAVGITFDTANVAVRGESPAAAARRVAPYVRATHVRDVALVRESDGLRRYLVPVGEGVIDWRAVLDALAPAAPMLSIEGIIASRAGMSVPVFDPRWAPNHPEMVIAERDELLALADDYQRRAHEGEVPDATALAGPVEPDEPRRFLENSMRALRTLLAGTRPSMSKETA
ncbi:sugar phosphate isomerase/epimerase [Microbacterium kribbense]|uniref:Sugar phosphate isomerase/epimerase n=1 Tax=Microbacterium kribbense TaxID=433645 RepID=A0ABP7GHV9_9MICO